jgi:hypothetical protein
MNVNFFWSGPSWQFINRVTIASHLKVGHNVIMWTHDKKPKNKFWVDDMPVVFEDSNKYLNVAEKLATGWNFRTISTIFQYEFMKKTGEYTADCDAIALKHWPDEKWCLVSESEQLISSVGVLRVPPNHPVLDCAITRAKKTWGNVRVFSDCCKKRGLKSTYNPKEFYPVSPHKREKIPYILRDSPIPNAYSYHAFFNSFGEKNVTEDTIVKEYENSLLKRIADWALEKYGYVKKNVKI